jgi:hypothetical protein
LAHERDHLTEAFVALNEKLHLVNNAIDQIGWTPYQTKVRGAIISFMPYHSLTRFPTISALLPERFRLCRRLPSPAPPEYHLRPGRTRVPALLPLWHDRRGIHRLAGWSSLLGLWCRHHWSQNRVQVRRSIYVYHHVILTNSQLLPLHLRSVLYRGWCFAQLDCPRRVCVPVCFRRRRQPYHGHRCIPGVLPEQVQLGLDLDGLLVGCWSARGWTCRLALLVCVLSPNNAVPN